MPLSPSEIEELHLEMNTNNLEKNPLIFQDKDMSVEPSFYTSG